MRARGWCVVLMLLLAAGGAVAAGQDKSEEMGEYTIGAEDILSISVWQNQDLSRSVPVRLDGMISLPLVNDVQAAGLTPMQLREVISKRLADRLSSPEVSVIVSEVHSFKVSVLGEVERPGRYELKSRTTILDILALAGGFKEFSSSDRIVILRTHRDRVERIPFNYRALISDRGGAQNLPLQPGHRSGPLIGAWAPHGHGAGRDLDTVPHPGRK